MSLLAEPLRNSSCSITDIQQWGNVLDHGHLEVGQCKGARRRILASSGLKHRSFEGYKHKFVQPLEAQSQHDDFSWLSANDLV